MGLGPRVGLQVGKHAYACGQERSSGNPELETKPGFRMSLMERSEFEVRVEKTSHTWGNGRTDLSATG